MQVLRINDKDYSITFATYFNVEWTERRLTVDPDFLALHNNTGGAHMVPMNLEFIKDLWLPNIFIYNIKSYKVIDVLSKLAGLWIDTERMVLYSQATHISFICPMSFDKFPLDEQVMAMVVVVKPSLKTVVLVTVVTALSDRYCLRPDSQQTLQATTCPYPPPPDHLIWPPPDLTHHLP